MYTKTMLDSEDEAMVELLVLKDAIDLAIQCCSLNLATPPASEEARAEHENTLILPTNVADLVNIANYTSDTEYQRMLSSYEELGRKLLQCKVTPAPPRKK